MSLTIDCNNLPGDAYICEKCDKIRVKPDFSYYAKRGEARQLRLLDDTPDDREEERCLLSVADDPDGYYLPHTGICQECIEKYHYHMLSREGEGVIDMYEQRLIDMYEQRAEHFGGVAKYIEGTIERFSLNLRKEFLVALNPEVFERYKQDYDHASADKKPSLAKQYVDAIKPDIVAWIQKETDMRLAASQKRNAKRLRLLEVEKEAKQFLNETETCGGYCKSTPFSRITINYSIFPWHRVRKLKDLCKGKHLTTVEIYPTRNGLRESLKRMVHDPRYSVDVNEAAITGMYEFQQLLKGLPAWLAENNFWQ